MNIDNKTQKITASAFIHREGKLLVARRADTKKFLAGQYELPGGHIEFGETMEQGLAREIKEELHIDVKIDEPFFVFTYIDNNSEHSIEVDYFATLVSPDQDIKINAADHSEFRWVGPEEAAKLFAGNEEEGKAIKKGFAILNK
ncbi:MAG: NUDIX hydrolase [Candidatus Komeilibacteria bacterium]